MNSRKEIHEFLKNKDLPLNEALKEAMIMFIKETRKEYPQSLTVSDISKITNYSENSVYELLTQGKIPFAKKIKGWRVPRDTFLLWWFGSFHEEQIAKAV